MRTTTRAAIGGLAASLLAMTALSGTAFAQSTNLTMLVDNASHTIAITEALVEA